MKYLGGIEAGGTKFVCGISDLECNIVEKISFPTTTPEETMGKVLDFFSKFEKQEIVAIGVACFGPIVVDKGSLSHGTITSTPKLAWQNFALYDFMKEHFSCPIEINTDVNGSVAGEFHFGAGRGTKDLVYFTVGTGIGAGIIQNGKVGKASEVGHIPMKKHPLDTYEGNCPFHLDRCLEGLACGPAIENRWQVKSARELEATHLAWEIEAYYLAQAVMAVNLILSPDRVILGGGVMGQPHLISMVRKQLSTLDNGYFIANDKNLDEFVVTPEIEGVSGLVGSFCFARDAYKNI